MDDVFQRLPFGRCIELVPDGAAVAAFTSSTPVDVAVERI